MAKLQRGENNELQLYMDPTKSLRSTRLKP